MGTERRASDPTRYTLTPPGRPRYMRRIVSRKQQRQACETSLPPPGRRTRQLANSRTCPGFANRRRRSPHCVSDRPRLQLLQLLLLVVLMVVVVVVNSTSCECHASRKSPPPPRSGTDSADSPHCLPILLSRSAFFTFQFSLFHLPFPPFSFHVSFRAVD